MNNGQQIKEDAEKRAKEFAGGNYKKNHSPKSWDDRYYGFIAGAESREQEINAANKRIEELEKEMHTMKFIESLQSVLLKYQNREIDFFQLQDGVRNTINGFKPKE